MQIEIRSQTTLQSTSEILLLGTDAVAIPNNSGGMGRGPCH